MGSRSCRILVLSLLPLFFLIPWASPAAPDTPAVEEWSAPVWRGLAAKIDDTKGEPFASLKKRIEDKIAHSPVFAGKDKDNRSDEIFLVSPRNTKIRPSFWNRTFIWNLAVDGRDYVLHVYSGEHEVVKRPMGMARRAIVSEHEAPFIPGVEYSWDVSLCVERCNLHLSSRPFLRPKFCLLSSADEERIARGLDAVTAWCQKGGISKSEEEAALAALVLEESGLFMEQQQLLEKELKRRPDSILLHLVLSGALLGMNSPSGAQREYEAARALAEKARGTAAGPTE